MAQIKNFTDLSKLLGTKSLFSVQQLASDLLVGTNINPLSEAVCSLKCTRQIFSLSPPFIHVLKLLQRKQGAWERGYENYAYIINDLLRTLI